MTDTGKAQSTLIAERDAVEDRLKAAELTIHDLGARLEEGSREFTDMGVLRQRIAEEMEDERKQFQKDLAERDFTADQTRKKYQGIVFFYLYLPCNNMTFSYTAELAQLSEGQCSVDTQPGVSGLILFLQNYKANEIRSANFAKNCAKLVQATMSFPYATTTKYTMALLGKRNASVWRPRSPIFRGPMTLQ